MQITDKNSNSKRCDVELVILSLYSMTIVYLSKKLFCTNSQTSQMSFPVCCNTTILPHGWIRYSTTKIFPSIVLTSHSPCDNITEKLGTLPLKDKGLWNRWLENKAV